MKKEKKGKTKQKTNVKVGQISSVVIQGGVKMVHERFSDFFSTHKVGMKPPKASKATKNERVEQEGAEGYLFKVYSILVRLDE